jgi:hypothetical protein
MCDLIGLDGSDEGIRFEGKRRKGEKGFFGQISMGKSWYLEMAIIYQTTR